jgi:hypothetical protein
VVNGGGEDSLAHTHTHMRLVLPGLVTLASWLSSGNIFDDPPRRHNRHNAPPRTPNMILRRAIARARPRLLASTWSPSRAPTTTPLRHLSAESESIESSANNSLKQLQSIHAQLSAQGDHAPPAVNPDTHATASSATDHVAEQYHLFKQQGVLRFPPHHSPTGALTQLPQRSR